MRRMIGVIAVLFVSLAAGYGGVEKGNRLYRDGRYAEAVQAYRQAVADGDASPALYYNMGTALLQLGRYDDAGRAFQDALTAVDPSLRQRTFYNMGNRFLQDARASRNPQASGKLYDAAVDAYKQSLRLEAADGSAKWNLELALRERDEQKRQNPQSSGNQQQQQQQQPQGGGGGGGGGAAPANPDQGGAQGPSGGGGGSMTQEEAARLLNAIEQNERELYKDALKKGRQERSTLRNW